ncbi:J domain-containing protein [Pontivivens insulae]|uniref:Chaperone protein DnaJ n=1 Tax=Pontivivens insulae TaxID=1639689 RepID=A0A2R8ACR4_9RHOB|nr:J domain-containing protein [Pontivivens insulae]RED13969.1 DnaJ-like protein [Pontivivens insulae]SPF30043.1 Chaperone protein DnaJ [Pontivivens insulae]
MTRKNPFEFDISVSADKKRRARQRGQSGAVNSSTKTCEHEGCKEPGLYRAPKAADRLEEFYWFCKQHIREYNQKWNFFENHTEEEFNEQIEKDRVGDRPTWGFKSGVEKATTTSHSEGRAWARFGFDDPHQVLGENATLNPAAQSSRPTKRKLPPTERRALDILGAEDTLTKTELRKVYKSLVKDLHPDMNGGKRDDEDKLQEVVWAWDQIKVSRSFRD